MLDICRILIAGTLLFGSTIHSSLTRASGLDQAPARASTLAGSGPCKSAWPHIVVTCPA